MNFNVKKIVFCTEIEFMTRVPVIHKLTIRIGKENVFWSKFFNLHFLNNLNCIFLKVIVEVRS